MSSLDIRRRIDEALLFLEGKGGSPFPAIPDLERTRIRELVGELHRRDIPLGDAITARLRLDGIDPTPPLKIRNLTPILVW